MNAAEEDVMLHSVEDYRDERRLMRTKPQRELPAALANDWEAKYDAKYREFKPREQFGKTFSSQYRRPA